VQQPRQRDHAGFFVELAAITASTLASNRSSSIDAREAVIRIGNNVFLNGTRFGCRQSISIGDDCILGDASLTDTDFHHLDPAKRHSSEPPPSAAIVVERNVWIGGASIILKGVTIGENSVIGAGSVVNRDVPRNCLAMGNPARVVKPI
jgi:acetyltransferase-like isoleucine patch superfamily enzyme